MEPFLTHSTQFFPSKYALIWYHMSGLAHPASNCCRWVGLRAFPDDLSGPGEPDEGRTDYPNLQLL